MLRFAAVVVLAAPFAHAQPAERIAPFFGFGEQRIIVIEDGCGPAVTADFNRDGLPDIAVVNNRKSRIEVYHLRATERSDADLERDAKANELSPNRWYDRELVSVRHRIGALRAHDADGDGDVDLVYAAADPEELVILAQEEDGFAVLSRRRVRDINAGAAGMEIADVVGDADAEILLTVNGRINVFPLTGAGRIGSPSPIGSGGIQALFVEDFDGNGRRDVLGVAPNDGAPLRLWLQREDPGRSDGSGVLPAELRFEMPPLTEAEPVRFPDRAAASIAVIERPTKRMVVYDLATEDATPPSESDGAVERDMQAEVRPFAEGSGKDRSIAVADADGDGLLDLLATNGEGNAVSVHLQQRGLGLGQGESSPTFKQPEVLAVGRWEDTETALFVMSGEEKTVGVAPISDGSVAFPEPLPLATPGAEPVAMAYVEIDSEPTLAVVVKKRRDHTLELHRVGEEATTVELEGVSRPPRTVLAGDADRDGNTDLMLLTPGEPMILVRGAAGTLPTEVLQKDDMPQFGLVQSAGPDNTVLADIDADGVPELMIADANFVRACVYDNDRGWSVVEQVNVEDAGTRLVGLAELGGSRLVASDGASDRLLVIGRDGYDRLAVLDRIRLLGFGVGAIRAGAFAGDDQPGVLCLGDDSFALVRLGGERRTLDQLAVWRSDDEDRFEHEIEVGDINGDGYVDLTVLDAGEQMCEFFTFSARRRLHFATEFKVFESRLFRMGGDREFEPSSALVADLTGDGRDDVMLTVHDRLIVYPQMTE